MRQGAFLHQAPQFCHSPTIVILIDTNVYITIHWLHRMDIFGNCYIHIYDISTLTRKKESRIDVNDLLPALCSLPNPAGSHKQKKSYDILHQPAYDYENGIIYKARPGEQKGREKPISTDKFTTFYPPEATVLCPRAEPIQLFKNWNDALSRSSCGGTTFWNSLVSMELPISSRDNGMLQAGHTERSKSRSSGVIHHVRLLVSETAHLWIFGVHVPCLFI